MDESRPQSEFNMAVSYLNRLNCLFYAAIEAALNLDAFQWFHVLLALSRELSTEAKKEEKEKIETKITEIHPQISKYINQLNRTGTKEIDARLYYDLHSLEKILRDVVKEAGLQNKLKESAEAALR